MCARETDNAGVSATPAEVWPGYRNRNRTHDRTLQIINTTS